MEKLFGEADHFIGRYGDPDGSDWISEVFFSGRYQLTLQVTVRVDARKNEATAIDGELRFFVTEIRSVEQVGDRVLARHGESFDFGLG